jgi:phage tail-like protein
MAVQRDNPYGAYNFIVDLGDGREAGFSEVSGLTQEVAVIDYRDGSDRRNSVRKLPGLNKAGDVTLKRGLVGTLDLYQWLKEMQDGVSARRTVTIQLLPEDRSGPVMTWKLVRAFPVKLVHGPLVAADSRVAVEEMVLAIEALEIE